MKGSLRAILGLLVLIGAAGGLDNASDNQILPIIAIAIAGGLLMFSGVSAMKGQQ